MRWSPSNVMLNCDDHVTDPSTATLALLFQVPSLLIHGPSWKAPPPPNRCVQLQTYPARADVDTLPSPMGMRDRSKGCVASVVGVAVAVSVIGVAVGDCGVESLSLEVGVAVTASAVGVAVAGSEVTPQAARLRAT